MNIKFDQKKSEREFLLNEYKKDPSLFTKKTFVEDSSFMAQIGIYIPEKDSLPNAYLKLWPQDFIVEEIGNGGHVETISKEPDNFEYGEKNIEGKTVYATIVKCGTPTIEVVKELSEMLECEVNQIQYAGLKDKDAITAQRISFRGIDIEKIKNLQSPFFFLKNIFIGKDVMKKGFLKGNKFNILLRTDASINDPKRMTLAISKLEKISEDGFYNFFYSQRFGAPRFINFLWAILILQERYEDAVKSFLTDTSSTELPFFQKIRAEANDNYGNWNKMYEIFKNLPVSFQNELKVLNFLMQHPDDFIGTLCQIPDQVSIWIQSLSSFFFNKTLSKLIEDEKEIPEVLPPIISSDRKSIEFYSEDLKMINLYPLNVHKILKHFPFFNPQPNNVHTKERIELHSYKIIPEGIALSFSLNKGSYATTFLSQVFNLISLYPPDGVSREQVDIKNILEGKDSSKTYEYFKEINRPKTDFYFNDLEK